MAAMAAMALAFLVTATPKEGREEGGHGGEGKGVEA